MKIKESSLLNGEIYHVFTKSIAGFKIFRDDKEYARMKNSIRYYTIETPPLRFSAFTEIKDKEGFYKNHIPANKNVVEIIAYCLMPTHIHLILKQSKENGISIFMSKILNSYTRYFNIKTKRKGPLWESRFKKVTINTDEQLLHLTRYIHLNPVTAHLADKPQGWNYSSFKEFLGRENKEECICNYSEVLEINPKTYNDFVISHIDYQRELAEIKKLFLE